MPGRVTLLFRFAQESHRRWPTREGSFLGNLHHSPAVGAEVDDPGEVIPLVLHDPGPPEVL
jgi:hypothetical protein